MTKILGTIVKKDGHPARVEVVSRAVTGNIVFVQHDPPMLTPYKDGQQIHIHLKVVKK